MTDPLLRPGDLVLRASSLDGWLQALMAEAPRPHWDPRHVLTGIDSPPAPPTEAMELGADFHALLAARQELGSRPFWPLGHTLPGRLARWDIDCPSPFGACALPVAAVERRYSREITMPDGSRAVLTGKVDLVIGATVIDWKVSTGRIDPAYHGRSMQGLAYLWLTGAAAVAFLGVERGRRRKKDRTVRVSAVREVVVDRPPGVGRTVTAAVRRIWRFLRARDLISNATAHNAGEPEVQMHLSALRLRRGKKNPTGLHPPGRKEVLR